MHPSNKHTIGELSSMTIPQILDFEEALNVYDMIKEAQEKDMEKEMELKTPKLKR